MTETVIGIGDVDPQPIDKIGPQLLGHSAYNWSLKHVSATFIAVVTLGEPVGSALLAWMFFGEAFALLQGTGFVLLLVGIYLAARGEGG